MYQVDVQLVSNYKLMPWTNNAPSINDAPLIFQILIVKINVKEINLRSKFSMPFYWDKWIAGYTSLFGVIIGK